MINKNNTSIPKRTHKLMELNEKLVASDPITQFSVWMRESVESNIAEPTAMTLATASKMGIPSARIVLLKAFDENGFMFFTNYKSSKASDLNNNPIASLLFFWVELLRQVRITGKIEKASQEESEKYFKSRPRESQLGAWASHQSSVIANRETLDNRYEEMQIKFEGKEIPLPSFWGGYRVIPNKIEFWQGKENRLHDRICYSLEKGKWKIERLAP